MHTRGRRRAGGGGAGGGALPIPAPGIEGSLTAAELSSMSEDGALALFGVSLDEGNYGRAFQILRRWGKFANVPLGEERRTVLHHAVQFSSNQATRLGYVREILAISGTDATVEDGAGHAPLYYAMQTMEDTEESRSVVRALVMQGTGTPPAGMPEDASRVAQEAHRSWSEALQNLTAAAEQGDVTFMRRTCQDPASEDFNFDSADPEGFTPLHIAAMHRQTEVAKILLEHNADPNRADHAGRTALHHACHLFDADRAEHTVLRHKTETDREKCAELLISFHAELDAVDCDGQPPLHYVCEAGLEGMILGLLKNGAAAQADGEEGPRSVLDAIRESSLRGRAQEAAGKYAAEQEEKRLGAEEERAGGAAAMATDVVPVPDDMMDMAPEYPDGVGMDMDMDMDMGMFGMGVGMGMGMGMRPTRRRPRREVKPFTDPVKGPAKTAAAAAVIESDSSDEEDMPVRPIGSRLKWGGSDDESDTESTPGLTEEERADMEGVSDDDDASEVSYESEVEYEVDSDEDHHFYESDDDAEEVDEDDDPNEDHVVALVRNPVGKRTVKEYGFRPIHEETLWKMREKGLQDVMNEFGIPKSAAAAVMKNYQWDLQEARRHFRRANEMPDEFLSQNKLDYDVSEVINRSTGETVFCSVSMEETSDWSGLDFCACKGTVEGGCRFSNEAWKGYFETCIDSGEVVGLKCMSEQCNVLVPEAFVEELVDDLHRQRYHRFLAESYVKDQTATSTIKFCPAPDCGHAMDARKATVAHADRAVTVRCICGYEFCYRCQEESHAPASCEELEEWNKRFTDDVETQQYLNTFCKPCPTQQMVDDFRKQHPTFKFHTTGMPQ